MLLAGAAGAEKERKYVRVHVHPKIHNTGHYSLWGKQRQMVCLTLNLGIRLRELEVIHLKDRLFEHVLRCR